MRKNTSDLFEELKNCSDFKRFYNDNSDDIKKFTVSEKLNTLAEEKNMKKSDIIKRSEINEIYGYQIFSGTRIPERKKLLCIAFGMELNLDEVQDLLKSTGFPPLYAKNPFDCIIIYAFCNHMTLIKTNELLYDFGEDTLG